MNAKKIFAERLRQLRLRRSESLHTTAEALGVTAQSLSLYEKGQRTINIDLLKKIAEYFGVSADYLIGLSDTAAIDTDMKAVCEYTGLTEESIENILNNLSERGEPEELRDDMQRVNHILNELLSSTCFTAMVHYCFAIDYENNVINKRENGETVNPSLLALALDEVVSDKSERNCQGAITVENLKIKLHFINKVHNQIDLLKFKATDCFREFIDQLISGNIETDRQITDKMSNKQGKEASDNGKHKTEEE